MPTIEKLEEEVAELKKDLGEWRTETRIWQAETTSNKRMWMVIGTLIIGLFGYTNWIAIPGAIDDNLKGTIVQKAKDREEEFTRHLASIGPLDSIAFPIGTIVAWHSTEAPPGKSWKICKGQTLVADDHKELARVLGTQQGGMVKIPDFTGCFLRGSEGTEIPVGYHVKTTPFIKAPELDYENPLGLQPVRISHPDAPANFVFYYDRTETYLTPRSLAVNWIIRVL